MLRAMKTVGEILDGVYGGRVPAANALGVVKSAPSNWLKWGHFPAHVAIQIAQDAAAKNIELPVDTIPVLKRGAA